jgi:SAM-dependent methyltransferase
MKMKMEIKNQKKIYLQVPARVQSTKAQRLKRALVGSILSPAYWLLASRYRVPGLFFRVYSALLGLRLLYSGHSAIPYSTIYQLLFWPINSTRYFEFDFIWRALGSGPMRRYLDVSSPWLFPIHLMDKKRELTAELVNPDRKDLSVTADIVRASNLENRCNVHCCLIDAVPFDAESFDVVTSISVVEHIPQDKQAVRKMWELLRSGGKLLLSVPCAAEALEQYISYNEYGLLEPDGKGFVFWQRIYDPTLLQERIFDVTGQPRRCAVYGEKKAGFLLRLGNRKMMDPHYPHWREPYMMGQEFRLFDAIADLPGEGVIAMEFVKP